MTNYLFYGLVTSVVSFGYTMILYDLGYHGEKIVQSSLLGSLGIIIPIIGLFLSIREARKEQSEASRAFTYGSVFKAGFLTTVFMAIGAAVFSYIYVAYINLDMSDAVFNMQREKLIEQGNPEEVIAHVEGVTQFMMQPQIQAILAFLGTILMGLIISLILGIFMRAKAPESTPNAT